MKINGRIILALFLAACLPAHMSGQEAPPGMSSVTSELDSYRTTNPFEELWLHTDRESYVAGEPVRVKVYLLSYPGLRIARKESYAYVELIDRYNNPVAQITVMLTRGTGESELLLPDSLVTGSYLLRAYTSVMKNYLPHGCFMKKITVANPFREDFLDLYTTLKFSHDPPARIDFFPEGGTIVSGLLTTVGVTVLNKYGYPAGCSAVVTNGRNEVVAEVTVDTTGIGSFDFVPEPGESYTFTPTVTGKRYPLPRASAGGINMRVTATGSESVSILLREQSAGDSKPFSGSFILVQSRGEILFTREIPSWTGDYEVKVPEDRMAAGINNIALFDATGNCLAERYFFLPQVVKENLHLGFDGQPGRRARISLQIDDPEGRISPDSLISGSISVAAAVSADKFMTASEYLLLGSEFRHDTDSPQMKESFPRLTPEARNIFLLGIKSVWIDWEKISSGRYAPPLYPEEVKGRYLVVSLASPPALTDEERLTAFLIGLGRRKSFQYAENDDEGKFLFFMESKHETDTIIIRIPDSGNPHPLKIESSFPERYLSAAFVPDTTPMASVMNELDKLAARHQIREIYGMTETRSAVTPDKEGENGWSFYGVPDQELHLEDYISLSSMREIFFELVRRMTVRSDRGEDGPVIWDPVLKRSPALFIDLVPVDDAGTILGLDPARIKQIDVITGDYLFGEIVFPGILNVTTHRGNFSDSRIPANTLISPFTMADPPSLFRYPDYSAQDKSRTPDLRNTIFWAGNLKRDSTGGLSTEFRCPDDSLVCEITVNLVDREGKIISGRGKLLLTGL